MAEVRGIHLREVLGRKHIAHVPRALHHFGAAHGQVRLLDGARAHAGNGVGDDEVWRATLGLLHMCFEGVLECVRDEGRDDDARGCQEGAEDKVRGVGEEADFGLEFEGEANGGLGGGVAAENVAFVCFSADGGDGHKVVDLDFEEGGENGKVIDICAAVSQSVQLLESIQNTSLKCQQQT